MNFLLTPQSLIETDVFLKKYKILVYEKFRQLNYYGSSSFGSKRYRKLCREAINLYVPLSYAVGLGNMGRKIEDLAFKELYPKKHRKIMAYLRILNYQRPDILRIKESLETFFRKNGLDPLVSGRIKRPYSIWKKMQDKKIPLRNITDIMAIRIITKNIDECYRALDLLCGAYTFHPESFKDYIENPKNNGYQSLHGVFEVLNHKKIEVQIRTYDMHVDAECINASHWLYKYSYLSCKRENYDFNMCHN
jgi:guanosine-3',5'-bis(diphosphate) 3'-pyrophosphohydrolase